MREPEHINFSAKDNKGDIMPTIELLECERVAYVKGMDNYLQKLKAMPDDEAIEKSRINLQNSNIIDFMVVIDLHMKMYYISMKDYGQVIILMIGWEMVFISGKIA